VNAVNAIGMSAWNEGDMGLPDNHTTQERPGAPQRGSESPTGAEADGDPDYTGARTGALADLFTVSVLDSIPQLDSTPSSASNESNTSDTEQSAHAAQTGSRFGSAAGWEPAPTTQMVAARSDGSPKSRSGNRRTKARVRADANDPALPPQIPLAPLKRLQARFNPLADWVMYLVIFAGGCFGTGVVFGLALAFAGPDAGSDVSQLYLATFIANTVSCFGYAALTTYMSQASWLSRRTRQLVGGGAGIGMWGSMSSTSMLMLQSFLLLRRGAGWELIGYLLVSFSAGILAALAGSLLSSRIMTRKRAATLMQVVANLNFQQGRRRHARTGGPAHAAGAAAAAAGIAPTARPGAGSGIDGSGHLSEPAHYVDGESLAAYGITSAIGQNGVPQTGKANTAGALGALSKPGAPDTPDNAGTVSTGYAAGELANHPTQPMSYEPKPITAEIPLIPDPITGEVR
jgi:CrcB protein